jgi:hypothetical protein
MDLMLRLFRIPFFFATTLAATLSFARPAAAQTAIYGQFTAQDVAGGWFSGGTFGIYRDRIGVPLLHVGADFRGHYLNNGGNSIVGGLGGIRVSVVPHVVPFKVYAEGLGGAAVVDYAGNHGTHFQYQVNGGLEYTFFPRFDWRVAEVAYNGYTGNNGFGNPFGISTGIVFRLP